LADAPPASSLAMPPDSVSGLVVLLEHAADSSSELASEMNG
jgi:hypothetical protein